MSVEQEWKTIRIDAGSYYKLTELSGLMTAITEEQYPLSNVAKTAIHSFYMKNYDYLLKLITDPIELSKFRIKYKKGLIEISKIYES